MKFLMFLTILIININVLAGRTLIVAVIDTGLGINSLSEKAKLCKYGHKDFTKSKVFVKLKKTVDPIPVDDNSHGTNIAGIIQKYAGDADYCIVIIKYYSKSGSGEDNIENTINAIEYATDIRADFINYSSGGHYYSRLEDIAIKRFLNQGGTFVAAAGNDHCDIDKKPYYPAMNDRRIVSVGALDEVGNIASYSNFGKSVKRWELGNQVNGFGIIMSGTSQATAITTGKLVRERKK